MKNKALIESFEAHTNNEIKLTEVEVLKRMRKIKRKGQQDAADAIGVSRRTIWRFENEKQPFSKDRRRKLLMAYGYSVSQLNNFMLGNEEIIDLPKIVVILKIIGAIKKNLQKKIES